MLRRFRRHHDDHAKDSAAEAVSGVQLQPEDEIATAQPDRQIVIRYRVLAVITLLVAAGILLASGALTHLPGDAVRQWPWVLIVAGVLWLLVGLVTAWPYGTLGGPVVIAAGVVALLDSALISSATMTLAGAITAALGLAIILRGLTMPRVRG